MNIHRLSEAIYATQALIPEVIVAASTVSGAIIDSLEGFNNEGPYRQGALLINVGTIVGTCTLSVFLQEAATSAAGSMVNAITTLTGSTGLSTVTAVQSGLTLGEYIIDIDIVKRQRYWRVQAIVTGTPTSVPVACDLLLLNDQYCPPTQDNTAVHV